MEHDTQIGVRVPQALLEQIDAFGEALNAATGVRVSRNEAVRVLLGRALADAPELKTRTRKRGA
jgi:hypothetical protein